MLIDVLPLPGHPARNQDGPAVLIDVLRATTTMSCALASGCRFIMPASDVEQAVALGRPYTRGEALLCGERGGVRIEGFDLGNSPLEYTEETVKDKVVILTTTNGTRALASLKGYEPVYLGSFLNSLALARELAGNDRVTLVCSGNNGRLSAEDLTCAGSIIRHLESAAPRPELTDSARLAATLFRSARARLKSFVASTEHGRELTALGFASDLEFALRLDSLSLVPRFADGRVTA